MNASSFGKNLKRARRRKQLTSEDLAAALQISGSYVRQIECGCRKPSVDLLIELCNQLGVSPEYLLSADLVTEHATGAARIEQLAKEMDPQQQAFLLRVAICMQE